MTRNKTTCVKDCPKRCDGCRRTCEEFITYETERLSHSHQYSDGKSTTHAHKRAVHRSLRWAR